LTADEGGFESEPFNTTEEAEAWAEEQLKTLKQKIDNYRKSLH
jgi:hypothetical protein